MFMSAGDDTAGFPGLDVRHPPLPIGPLQISTRPAAGVMDTVNNAMLAV